MRTAYQWLVEYLDLCGSFNLGSLWQCPAHDDSFPSLNVSCADEGKVLIHCFAGCEWEEVLTSLSLPNSILFQPHLRSPQKLFDSLPEKPTMTEFRWRAGSGSGKTGEWWDGYGSEAHITEVFHYYQSDVRQRRRRYKNAPKRITWQHLDGHRWSSRPGAVDFAKLPLYRTEIVASARAYGELVVLCESESSVDALEAAGIKSTTWAGGASSPQRDALSSELKGCNVLYIADNDEAGLKCIAALESFLPPLTSSWSVLMGAEGEDARDILERGGLASLTRANAQSE